MQQKDLSVGSYDKIKFKYSELAFGCAYEVKYMISQTSITLPIVSLLTSVMNGLEAVTLEWLLR